MAGVVERLNAALAGRYRIGSELGAGGMATVYLAEDLKHDRQVAIKVLKPELAAVLGAERFVQEIKTTAQLHHPHILPLHDSGTADGFLFYVMPYIEGETLRDKLDREAQLGLEEAVRITREVADALDYAHRQGIIHRDIKPENILLHDGRPVVADFGIALAVSAAAGGRMTETGTSVGTPHYMAPEQATGDKQITGRADIYSLASVLYEMLAGEPPHSGATAQAVIMKIIAEPVQPVEELRKSVPPNVAAAVGKALQKLPADRFESAKAFADALGDPTFSTLAAGQALAATAGPRSWRGWVRDPRSWAALSLAGVLGAVAVLSPSAVPEPHLGSETLRFSIRGPEDPSILAIRTDPTMAVWGPVVSPDGRTVAFTARTSRGPVLYVRRLDAFDLFAVPDGGGNAFFSPDGESIGFFRDAEVWTLELADPVPTRVGSLPEVPWDVASAAWHPDGRILVAGARGLWTLLRDGGEPTLLIAADLTERERFGEISVLPDGRILLNIDDGEEPRVEVVSPDGAERVRILPGFDRARAVDDVLFFEQGGQARAVAFDLQRVEPVGRAIVLTDQSHRRVGRSIAWVEGSGGHGLDPVWVSPDGSVSPVGLEPAAYRGPRASPDGSRIAIGTGWGWGETQIRTTLLRTGAASDLDGITEPVWSVDSRQVFMSRGGRPFGGLLSQVFDGSAAPDTLLALDTGDAWPTGVSRDGRWLAYYGATLGSGEAGDATDPSDLMFMELDTRQSRRIRITGAQRGARFSPDGRWVAYQSTESGFEEVYIRPWPAMDTRYQISDGGGTEPLWSPDGRTVYYRQADAVMQAAITVRDGAIERAAPTMLFTGNFGTDRSGDQSWDIAPDGRFLMMRPVSGERIDLHVALNWIAEIRARLERAR
jgi:Tol biopolymer transport system component